MAQLGTLIPPLYQSMTFMTFPAASNTETSYIGTSYINTNSQDIHFTERFGTEFQTVTPSTSNNSPTSSVNINGQFIARTDNLAETYAEPKPNTAPTAFGITPPTASNKDGSAHPGNAC